MLRRKRRLMVEFLEPRRVLSADWFVDGGQQLGMNAFRVALGDLDGDEDVDAFVGCHNRSGFSGCKENTVWLNDGQGGFSQGWSATVGAVTHVALGDFDKDGDLDAFVALGAPTPASPNSFPNEVWLNDGHGNFTDSGQRLGRAGSFEVGLGDLDGDGDLDALVANVAGNTKVWLNDGGGNFTDNRQNDLRGVNLAVALGDLDGDGDLDAYVGQAYSSPDRVWLNDGEGNLSDSGQQLGRGFANGVRLGDLDGDGDLDAFVANGDQRGTSQPNEVWLNDGAANFTDSGQSLGRSLSRQVALGDLDGDRDLDAFVGNGIPNSRQPNRVWLNDGAGLFSDSGQDLGNKGTSRVEGTTGVVLADLDSDGDLDALLGQLRQGNEVWLNVIGEDRELVWDGDSEVGIVGDGTTWDDPNNWSVGGTYDAGPPTAAHDVTFPSNATHATVDLGTNRYVSSLTFDSDVTLVGHTLTIVTGDVTVAGGATAAIASDIADRATLNKKGLGTLVFEGEAGDVNVEAGSLLGAGTLTSLTVASEGALLAEISPAGTEQLKVSRTLELSPGSTLELRALTGLGASGKSQQTIVNARRINGTFTDEPTLGQHVGSGVFTVGALGGPSPVLYLNDRIMVSAFQAEAGDANGDGKYDQADVVKSLQGGRYRTGGSADWTEGDWNGDGLFDQGDIVIALQTGNYLQGAYAAQTKTNSRA